MAARRICVGLVALVAGGCADTQLLGGGQAAPVGLVAAFTGDRVPPGWLLCDGRALRRSEWPELYAVIGTSHGNGVSELGVKTGDFNLPDYRGRFLRGVDLSSDGRPLGSDPDAHARSAARAGTGNSGNRVGSYQPDATALPRDPLRAFRVAEGVPATRVGTGETTTRPATRADTLLAPSKSTHGLITGGDAETRPKNVAVQWIIRSKP